MRVSVLCALVAFATLVYSAPADSSSYAYQPKTLIYESNQEPNGNYFYKYYLDNGDTQEVEGKLKNVNGNDVFSVKGFYSYRLPNGQKYRVEYVADENGYRVTKTDTYYEQQYINPKSVASLLGG